MPSAQCPVPILAIRAGGVGGWNWWIGLLFFGFAQLAADPLEEEEVEEVHAAEHEQDGADFRSEGFEHIGDRGDLGADLEEVADESEVHEVEPDDEEVVDTVGEFRFIIEALDKEWPTALGEGACDPDGQRDADEQVEGVGGDEECAVHFFVSFCVVLLVISVNTESLWQIKSGLVD